MRPHNQDPKQSTSPSIIFPLDHEIFSQNRQHHVGCGTDSALTHMSHDKNAQENKPIKEGFVEEGDDSRSQMIKDKTVVFDEEEEDGTV